MTLTQLQYILAVAECQSFTEAAERCFVTQPTLSMQIQKLENELDVQIFDRKKHPVKLTPIGKKIKLQAQNIISDSKKIKDFISHEKKSMTGEFRIGIIPTIMPTLLPMFLDDFIKKYPDIKLKIEEHTTSIIIKKLKKNQLDTAILATPLNIPELIEKPLFNEPILAYIPNYTNLKNNININDLENKTILLLNEEHCFHNNVLNFCNSVSLKKTTSFEIKSGSFETILTLSDKGMGMTFLPYLHTLNLENKRRKNIFHFKNPQPAREVSLLHHKSEFKLHIINALENTINNIIDNAITFKDLEVTSPLNT